MFGRLRSAWSAGVFAHLGVSSSANRKETEVKQARVAGAQHLSTIAALHNREWAVFCHGGVGAGLRRGCGVGDNQNKGH